MQMHRLPSIVHQMPAPVHTVQVACVALLICADVALPCSVINEDDKPFDFTAALHSYFEIQNLQEANVRGLKGLKYLDKSEDPESPVEKTEDRDQVTFGEGLVDSVYLNAPDTVELDVATGALCAVARPMSSVCHLIGEMALSDACCATSSIAAARRSSELRHASYALLNSNTRTSRKSCSTLHTQALGASHQQHGSNPNLPLAGAAVQITSTGWTDCVVWNPHLTMKECYKEFVCVENAQFGEAVTVKPGENWRATTVMDVIDL